MKKMIFVKQAFCVVIACLAIKVFAASYLTQTVNGIEWKYVPIDDGGVAIGAGSTYSQQQAISPFTSGSLTIPSRLGGKPVRKINHYAFRSCSGLTSVTIPNCITAIGLSAFSGCSGLESITIPDSIISISTGAFIGCSSLKTIVFQGNAPSVDSNVFPSTCTAYIMPSSTGWEDMTIAGTWNGIKIAYLKSVEFNANGGSVSAPTRWLMDGSAVGVLPTPTWPNHTFNGWFTTTKGGTRVSEKTMVSANTTYYAQWTADQCKITFDANGGVDGISRTMDYDAVIGELPRPTCKGYVFLGWFTAREGGDNITSETIVSGDATYYAHWIVSPYVFRGDADWTAELDGSWKSGAIADSQTSSMEMKVSGKCRVSFKWKCSCEPLVKGNPYDYLSFAIDGVQQKFICGETDWVDVTTDVRSRGSHTLRWTYIKDAEGAVGEDCAWVSDVSVSEIPPETFGDFLNCPGRTFTIDGDSNWVLDRDVSADGYALRSGEVTHSQTSRLETVVYGAGIIAFRCKVDGEIVKKIVYDGLAFRVDGEQQGDLMGDADWTEKMFTVTGDGRHVLSWLYVKDEEGDGGGADCAWLDNVVWTPDDPLPPLDVSATDNDAQAIVAGLSDVRLFDKIGSTAAYAAFRNWVDGNGLSHALVKDAPEAWLSYALDAPGLMAKPEPLASDDVVIESIAPSSAADGAFDLAVSIGGAEIGEGARLAEVLGIEGAAELDESAFSSEGLTVSLGRTDDGKSKATVTPDGAPPAFFLRVRVK